MPDSLALGETDRDSDKGLVPLRLWGRRGLSLDLMASGVSGRSPDLERGPGMLPALCLLPHVGIWFCSAGAKLGGRGVPAKSWGEQGPFVCSRVCLFPLNCGLGLKLAIGGTVCDRKEARSF